MRTYLNGTDLPVMDWEYAGSNYRLSIVGGLTRMEQQIHGGWYLVEPNHDTTAMLVCAEQLVRRLHGAEQALLALRTQATSAG